MLVVNSLDSDQTAPSAVGIWMPHLQTVMWSSLILVQTVCMRFKIIRLFQQKIAADNISIPHFQLHFRLALKLFTTMAETIFAV